MIHRTALPGTPDRLVTVRIEVPIDDRGFMVAEYKTRLVTAEVESSDREIDTWLTANWFEELNPQHVFKFIPEGPYYMTILSPDTIPADDTWPYEHTETAEQKPSHRKPYRDKDDGDKANAWIAAGKPRGRHA